MHGPVCTGNLHLLPAVLVFPTPQPDHSFPYLDVFQDWHAFVSRLGLAYAALVFVLVSLAFADACETILSPDQETDNPISGIVRASKRIVTLLGNSVDHRSLGGREPVSASSVDWGLSRRSFFWSSAIIFWVSWPAFKSSTLTEIVKVGDWIEMPNFGANGDVTAISLNVIKVQNSDKTISTIPTHTLLTESFRNWSGMLHAGRATDQTRDQH